MSYLFEYDDKRIEKIVENHAENMDDTLLKKLATALENEANREEESFPVMGDINR